MISNNLLWYSLETDLFSEIPTELGMWTKNPHTICIESNYLCNYRCGICISDSGPTGDPESSWILNSLYVLREVLGPVRIVWSGGEPTLSQDVLKGVEKSHSLGNANVLATNASRYVDGLNVDWVDISMYGADPEDFYKITNSKKFLLYKDNITRYLDNYPRVSASFILGAYGEQKIQKMLRFATQLGISRLKFHRLSSKGRHAAPFSGDGQFELERNVIEPLTRTHDICATFSRTTTSEHKASGYWVVKPPGVITNLRRTIQITDTQELLQALGSHFSENRSLFTGI